MGKKEKINLLWLAKKGLIRYKFWFFLKLLIIILWAFFILNIYMLFNYNMSLINKTVPFWITSYLLGFINLLCILLVLVMTTLTLRLRKNEFGLYRCNGATRGEIISLILNEGVILSFVSIICVLIIEFLFIYQLKIPIIGLFNISLDYTFFLDLAKGFLFSFFFIFVILFICYLPFAVYYAFKDPYNIIRY